MDSINGVPVLYYNISWQLLTKAASATVPLTCNGFTVKNTGTTIILINGQIPVVPGSSIAIGGNYGEIYAGRVDITFEVPTPAPAVITNSAVVMFKAYMNGKGYDNRGL